MLTWAPRF
jgi:hypothetical protein